ncbi:MAG: hypothetical protein Q4G25_10985 [Paracoccus sp. (in: a-proteobacteria)]|nr:hypothetical protein [Paracoccus sp. (in: a-proteobacteria)]
MNARPDPGPGSTPALGPAVYFALTGLAFGAAVGWLALNSWLGIGFLIIGVLLVVGIWGGLDIATDLAGALIRPAWRSIARTGHRLAGADPGQPAPSACRAAFGAAFVAGLAAVVGHWYFSGQVLP